MARERGVFLDSLFSVLGKLFSRKWELTGQRHWLAYGLLTTLALLGTAAAPGMASLGTPWATPTMVAQASPHAAQLDQRAREHYEAGRFSDAATAFEQAAIAFRQAGNLEQAANCQVNQARALQGLGLYSRAVIVLQRALQSPAQPELLLHNLGDGPSAVVKFQARLAALPATPTTVFALRSLGDALQVGGDLDQAESVLKHSLALAEQLELTEVTASIDLSLGNVTRTRAIANLRLKNLTVNEAIAQLQKPLSPVQQELQWQRTKASRQFMAQTDVALDYYQQAVTTEASTELIQAQAQLNALSLRLDRQQWAEAIALVPALETLVAQLPQSQSAVVAQINFAESLMRMAETPAFVANPNLMVQAAQGLAMVQQQALNLGNPQIESYAFGSLGELYRRTQQWAEAKTLTEKALEKVSAISVNNLPQTVNDADLAYRWYRQLGKILDSEGDRDRAIETYETALKILQRRLRLDVASSNLNYQFAFSEAAQEPVHRELMDLLLRPTTPSQQALQRVREISSSLIETELTSFLQEPCSVTTPQEIDAIVQDNEQNVAVVYPIVLPDRLEVVVKLPNSQELIHYRHPIPQNELLQTVNDLKFSLEDAHTFTATADLAKQLYDWILKPAEQQLKANGVDTMIFTLDRRLQPIPMAALYDGESYLIEQYAISEFLGLSFDNTPTPLRPGDLKIMAAGLSTIPLVLPEEYQNNFFPLSFVTQELEALQSLGQQGIRVVPLQDEAFTLANFNSQLNEDQFPVVHLATHGQFSADPQSTFLLTSGESTNALVDVNKLGALFRVRGQIRLDSIELLVLNACETAAGDKLATLGIAGAAVRSGARSAIASLWTLDDAPSVDFTKALYEQLLQPDITKAEALRQAQLALLHNPQYQHPRYWSPYILAGNWLPLVTLRDQ